MRTIGPIFHCVDCSGEVFYVRTSPLSTSLCEYGNNIDDCDPYIRPHLCLKKIDPIHRSPVDDYIPSIYSSKQKEQLGITLDDVEIDNES